MYYKRPNKPLNTVSAQKGIVLLAAMLVVVIATGIIVSITHSEAFSIRKTSRIQALERVSLFTLALEDWSRLILLDDKKQSKEDYLTESWANRISGLPINGVFLTGWMEDEQSKININNLLTSEESLNRFKRLCAALDVNTDFIDALLDWMDDDFDLRFPNGHEDSYNTYRVANRPLSDITELMLIQNMTQEIYNKLRPHITVLPTSTGLNVNTMTDQVFLSLGTGLDLDKYTKQREKEVFKDITSFIEELQLAIPVDGLSVSTEYFYMHGEVIESGQSLKFNTLIHRDSAGKTKIINRSLGQV